MSAWRKRLAWLAALALALLMGWTLRSGIFVLDEGVEGLAQWIRDQGALGVAASIALMTAHSFLPFPSEILTLANGVVYGPLWGTVISWVGAMSGAAVAFAVGRALGAPVLARLLKPAHSARFARWSQARSAPALLVARLIPLIAFNLINYSAAIARVPWWTFLWTTGVGILPATILLCTVGDRMLQAPLWAWLAAALALLVVWRALRWFVQRFVEARDGSA